MYTNVDPKRSEGKHFMTPGSNLHVMEGHHTNISKQSLE